MNKVKIFEVYVLRTLSIQFILTGVLYLFYKQWWIGIIIIIISFLFGTIGQGLKHNRQRSAKDLTKGQDWNFVETSDENGVAENEGYLIGRPFLFTCCIVIITSVIIFVHHGFKWNLALLLGFLIGFVYPSLLFLIGLFNTWLIVKINKPKDEIKDDTLTNAINPNDAKAYKSRGNAKYNSADYRGAIADYSKAIAINPNDAGAYYNRGNAKAKLNDYQGAIADLNKAIAIDPKNAIAYFNRGIAKYKLGDKQGAIADFTKAITIDPHLRAGYYNRGTAKDELGDHYGSIVDFTQAIAINPKDVRAYGNRGNVKYRLEDYQGAIQDFTQVIAIDPNDAIAYTVRGTSKYHLGDHQGAYSDWSKAGELGDADAYKLIQKYCQ